MEEAKHDEQKHRDRIGVRRARFENTGDEKKERKNISPPTLKGYQTSNSMGQVVVHHHSLQIVTKRSFAMLLINRSSVMRALHLRTQGLQQRRPRSTNAYIHDNRLGCKHYHRKCKIVAACCNVPFMPFLPRRQFRPRHGPIQHERNAVHDMRVDPTDCKKLQKLQHRNGAILLQSLQSFRRFTRWQEHLSLPVL